MLFGLNGALASLQRLIDQLIKDCQKFAAVYLDDLVIFSSSWENHLKQLEEILSHIAWKGKTNCKG